MALWIEYRTCFGRVQLREVCGGDFVIVSEDLCDEFEAFKKKVYSYVNRAYSIVKAVELIDVWCTAGGGGTLKPLHLLGSVYNLMSSAQLDSFCQWVCAKRRLFSSKDEFSLKKIVESQDQTSRHPGDVIEKNAVDGPKTSTITYLPPCDEWQRSLCQRLGMTFIRRNITHILQPKEYSISHQPAATVRILGDGNCFFRALAFVITGSQDEHLELRTIATSYMQHNAENLSCYLKQWTSI